MKEIYSPVALQEAFYLNFQTWFRNVVLSSSTSTYLLKHKALKVSESLKNDVHMVLSELEGEELLLIIYDI